MSRRTALGAAGVAGAAAAALVGLLLPAGRAPGTASAARPLAVRASFEPAAATFGDRLLARVVVTLDANAVRPSTLRVPISVAPLTQLGPARRHEVTRGSERVVTIDVPVACLSGECLGAGKRIAPPPLEVAVARSSSSDALEQQAVWEPVQIAGRVTPADVAASKPPFRTNVVPPSVSYRVRPRLVALVLDALAVLLAALAAAAVASAVLGNRRAPAGEETDELSRALRLARSARSRPAPDRRIAAGHLARLLSARSDGRARRADDLAWSRPAPTGESLTELVESVEREQRP